MVARLDLKFTVFYGTRNFITVIKQAAKMITKLCGY